MNDEELKKRLYVPNYGDWRDMYNKDYFSDRELGTQLIKDGVILPPKQKENQPPFRYNGGVCDRDLKFITGYNGVSPDSKNCWCGIDAAYTIDERELVTSDEDVIWGGAMIFHFGHFMTEVFHRLWYLFEHPEDTRKIVLLKVGSWSIKSWVWSFFDLFDLPKSRVIILEQPTRFKSILIPAQSVYISSSYTKKFLSPYRQIVKKLQPFEGVGKIFLSRSEQLQSRTTLLNQKYFEVFYRNHGYKIIYPEELSLADQIRTVSGADEIVTFYGTLSHWTLFCKPGTKFTSLTRVTAPISKQFLMDKATGVDWCVVNVSMNFMHCDQGGGVFLLGSTEEWRRYVSDHFDEKIKSDYVVPEDMFDDYVNRWCQYMSKPEEMKHRISTLKNLWHRVNALEFRVKKNRPPLRYQAHLAVKGWLPYNMENDIAGVKDQPLDLQALKIDFYEPYCDVLYSVYYPTEGWTEEVANNQLAGTTGRSKSIYGLCIRLPPPPIVKNMT